MKTASCDQCGDCCSLFYINLNEIEYKSNKYQTIFSDFDAIESFDDVVSCGANFLAKNENGSCVYLENKSCSIHADRPEVCRAFFCKSSDGDFSAMRKIITDNKG
ncbi:MAG: YkgJ family cysteine cluster protein [Candidatus Berkelbacteria bacterium]